MDLFTFSFTLPSQFTVHSFPPVPLLLVEAIFLGGTLNPKTGCTSISCSKPKQLDQEEKGSVHFPNVSKHLDVVSMKTEHLVYLFVWVFRFCFVFAFLFIYLSFVFFFFFFLVFLPFLEPLPQHMEVPRLGV